MLDISQNGGRRKNEGVLCGTSPPRSLEITGGEELVDVSQGIHVVRRVLTQAGWKPLNPEI